MSTGQEPSFVCILRFEPSDLLHYRRSLGLRSERSALRALAGALAASEPWSGLPGVSFTVRPGPEPALGIVAGEGPDGVDPRLLLHQARAYENAPGRLRYLGYREVETAVRRLAAALVGRFGLSQARSFRYAAIPRGGSTVLGLLASHLDVPADQLLAAAPPDDEEPLVVIDDCALSGARFAAFLGRCSARQVVFGHLFSHPALREALLAAEPRVSDCLAGQDLRDEGPGRLDGDWADARERWRHRLGPGGHRYWLGDCERIAFPWNEPDRVVWNPETEEVDLGWKLVPPEHCLKHGAELAARPRPRILDQPRGPGPWRPASAVLFTWRRGETVAHKLDTGESFRLPGTAHAMWWALLRGGDLTSALRLLPPYPIDGEILAADLARFFQTLQQRNLFEKDPS